MENNIEIEVRGPIEKKDFNRLKKFFDKNAKFINEKDRLSLLYFRNEIPKDINDLKDDKVDLRLRITNKKAEIMLKYGSWAGSDIRKEISIPIDSSNIEHAIEFLKILDWYLGVIYTTKTYVYKYKEIEFSLVNINNFRYTCEAEILAKESDDVEKLKTKIISVFKELNLREYRKGEFEELCNEMNNKKSLRFNFKKDDVKETLKRFNRFFSF